MNYVFVRGGRSVVGSKVIPGTLAFTKALEANNLTADDIPDPQLLAEGKVIDFNSTTGTDIQLYPVQETTELDLPYGLSFQSNAVWAVKDDHALLTHIHFQMDFEGAITQAKSHILRHTEKEIDGLKAKYPAFEVESWPEQKSQAVSYTTGDETADISLLEALANQNKVSLDTMAKSILDASSIYSSKLGNLLGAKQSAFDKLDAIHPENKKYMERILKALDEWSPIDIRVVKNE